MKVFPTIEKEFVLTDNQEKTLDRLKRRTDYSKNLTSQKTDKSFRGEVNENKFKIISSAIGKGAFCVLTGEISSNRGIVKVEIHKIFKVLSSVLLLLPILGLAVEYLNRAEDFSPVFLLIVFAQLLFIRFGFIELSFRSISKSSLNRLRHVLDIEWKNNRQHIM
ncbi:hypothetical protein [Persicobacter diffluens]|uniref:Uncharacterized protein n=1 Tax=Persicobacter diffluens TaxID=981 RepID=A0AAN4VZI3_9BACT|nr:hypothetical protein PEDI_35060 [Persicobacter diffluens]